MAESESGHPFTGPEAADLADRTGWRLFPVNHIKKPVLGESWPAIATADRDALIDLWDQAERRTGKLAWPAIACGPSGLVVFDQDVEADHMVTIPAPAYTLGGRPQLSGRDELELVVGAGTLTMRSRLKEWGRHYYFTAPDPADGTIIGCPKWVGGEIKGVGGYVAWTGATDTDGPLQPVPGPLVALYGRPPSSGAGTAVGATGGPHDMLDPLARDAWFAAHQSTYDGPEWDGTSELTRDWPTTRIDYDEGDLGPDIPRWIKLLAVVLVRMWRDVDKGKPRRETARNASLAMALDADAGLYPAEVAYRAGMAVYRELRDTHPGKDHTSPAKRWNRDWAQDYDWMWRGAIPKLGDPEYAESLAEKRRMTDIGWRDWEEESGWLPDWYTIINNGHGWSTPQSKQTAVPEPGPPDPPLDLPTGLPAAVPLDDLAAPELPAEPPFVGAAAGDPTVLLPPRHTPAERFERGPHAGPTRPARPHGTGRFGGGDEDPPPVLRAEAFYGPIGEFAREAAVHSEAPEAGILLAGLVTLGFVAGPACFIQLGNAPHGPCDYAVLVARSGEGKDIAADLGRGLIMGLPTEPAGVAVDWQARSRVVSGIASGEALNDMWRPAIDPSDPDGPPVKPDRRILFREPEMGSVMARIARQDSTLGPYLRAGWDRTGNLEHRTASSAKAGPSKVVLIVPRDDYSISVLCNGTPAEIRRSLRAVDIAGGTANRFLWAAIGKPLALHADGGNVPLAVVRKHRRQLHRYLSKLGLLVPSIPGHTVIRCPDPPVELQITDQPCYPLYADDVYPRLTRERSERGPAAQDTTARLPAHLWRIAQMYALSVGEWAVSERCFLAALAIIDWSAQSTEWLFGSRTGDPRLDEFIAVIYDYGPTGMNASDANKHFGPRYKELRAHARALGMIEWHTDRTGRAGKAGRPPEHIWHRDFTPTPPETPPE